MIKIVCPLLLGGGGGGGGGGAVLCYYLAPFHPSNFCYYLAVIIPFHPSNFIGRGTHTCHVPSDIMYVYFWRRFEKMGAETMLPSAAHAHTHALKWLTAFIILHVIFFIASHCPKIAS